MLPKIHPVQKTYIELRRSKERLQMYINSTKDQNAINALGLIIASIESLELITIADRSE